MKSTSLVLSVSLILSLSSCGNKNSDSKDNSGDKKPDIRTEEVSYSTGDINQKGFVAYDANRKEKLPIVLVVHEWWGQTDYPRKRARELAELGYLAFAVDMFGDGKTAQNPDEAMKLAGPFYADPALGRARLEAALAKAKLHSAADSSKSAAIGYCFGGAMVLNAAKMGMALNSAVSFHGGLQGPAPHKGMKTDFLVLHGASDQFVPPADVALFRHQMDSVNASYTFKEYAGATHAFTNPDATENGKKFNLPIAYNAAADTASWKEMEAFLSKTLR